MENSVARYVTPGTDALSCGSADVPRSLSYRYLHRANDSDPIAIPLLLPVVTHLFDRKGGILEPWQMDSCEIPTHPDAVIHRFRAKEVEVVDSECCIHWSFVQLKPE